jgi:hypothetical protein
MTSTIWKPADELARWPKASGLRKVTVVFMEEVDAQKAGDEH